MWNVMPRNVWNDIVSWQTRRLNNSTKYQLHALINIISKKKNWNLLENCHKYALKLFWNACTWNVLEDLIFCGHWINLHDRSRNGPKLVANAWISCYLTFITHVNINRVVMWVILQNNAGWDFFKTPILREILLEEHRAFFGSHTFVPMSWMCKKQTSVSHSSTESEIISLDAGLRLDGFPALDLWDLIVAVLGNTNQNHDTTGRPVKEQTWSSFNTSHNSKTKAISRSDQCFGKCWSYSSQRPIFAPRSFVVCLWRQRSSGQDDYETWFQNPQSCSSLVVRSNQFGPNNPNQMYWHQKTNMQTCSPRETSHVMNGIICLCLF